MMYRDASAFLRPSRLSRIVIPYYHPFKRSSCKIIVIFLIAAIAPFPSIRNIYSQDEPHLTLLFLQYTEMGLVSLTGLFCYMWTAIQIKSLEKIYRGVLYTHRLFQVLQKRSLVYSSTWLVTYDILVTIMAFVNSASQIIDRNIELTHNAKPLLIHAVLGTISYFVPIFLVHCLGSFFRSCLYGLNVQLTHLNRLLSSNEFLKAAHMENLVYTHCLIGNTFRQLNSAQTLPVMLLSSCTFFVVVYNLYDMLTFNLEESLNNTLGDNIGGVAWIIFWTSQLVVLVVLIENVVDKHEEFSARLHYIMIQDRTGNLGASNRITAHLAVQQKLEYSAAGFFSVNYKLISSITSSATTYLVILIQFAQLNEGTQKVQGDVHEHNKTNHF